MEIKELLQRAISHYGEKAQLIMLIEEMEELYETLTIYQEEYEKIVEEIADVAICLKQAFMIFNLVDDHYPVNSKVSTFNTIKHQATLFVCRASREREVSPCPMFELAGWVRQRTVDMDAEEDVQKVIKERLARLHGRLRNEK